MDLILSTHAISSAVMTRVPVGTPPASLVLEELRGLSRSDLARRIATLHGGTCWIVVDDLARSPLISPLSLLAGVLPYRRLRLVDHDGRVREISRASIAGRALPEFLLASATAPVDRRRCEVELKELARLPRQEVRLDPAAPEIVYLKVNVAHGVAVGGSVGHIAGVVNSFAREHAVRLFAAEPVASLAPGVHVEQLHPTRALGYPPSGTQFTFQREFAKAVAAAVRRPENVRFVYQRAFTNHYSGVVLARQWRKPLVLEYNGSEVWVGRHWGKRIRFEQLALQVEEISLRHAHVVVVVSDALRAEVLQRGVEPQRVVNYPNCVDPAKFDSTTFLPEELIALRRAHGIPHDATVVTFLGTFGRWHGVEVLARAIRQAVESRASWLREQRMFFLFLGDGQLMPEVRKQLDNAACRPYVALLGLVPQSEAPKYLAASDILVSPHVRNADGSPFFGSPTKLFEYMAMSRGIVASRLDQLEDVLSGGLRVGDLGSLSHESPHGSAPAVLVEPGDVQELQEGIRFLAEHPGWRAHLGGQARDRIHARYTWDHHTREILRGLGEVTPC